MPCLDGSKPADCSAFPYPVVIKPYRADTIFPNVTIDIKNTKFFS
jgi:hypothetical protein